MTPEPTPHLITEPGSVSSATDLTGRTALVTGAASGIGRACALRLAASGATVHAVDRDAEGLTRLTGSAVDHNRIRPEVLDLIDLAATERLAAEIRPDILVNNAGVQLVRPLEEFPPEDFDWIMRLMLQAPFRLIRGALPHMYARHWGRIVNLSSVHGLRASPYKSAYVTAKHGLEGLSKVTALEAAGHGVTSNCVSPGYVRTPLVERQIADQAAAHGIGEDRVISEILLAGTARKKLVEPTEVAEAVSYLCGPQAAAVTGISLPLDGGWTAR